MKTYCDLTNARLAQIDLQADTPLEVDISEEEIKSMAREIIRRRKAMPRGIRGWTRDTPQRR